MWVLEVHLSIKAKISINKRLYWNIITQLVICVAGYRIILQEIPEDALAQKSLSKNIFNSLSKW